MPGAPHVAGTTIAGRYVLTTRLGVGAFGEVWSAEDEKAFHRRVAIKFLLEQHVHNPEVVARFWREGEATAALSHPNVVSLLEFGDDGGVPFLVSEFVDGISLRALLEQRIAGDGPMPLADALEIFRQACAGVAAAHAKNIVHRDLKPENVMVQPSGGRGVGHVKVLDFGIARMLNADAQSKIKARTGAGQVLGSPQYMSPEQLLGDVKSVDERSDVFALAALFFETLTLRPAFAGTTYFEVVTAILDMPRPTVTPLRPELPAALDAVFVRATAVKREERYPSVAALREAVDEACAAPAPTPAVAPAPVAEPEAPKRQNTARMRRLSDPIPPQREEWKLEASGEGKVPSEHARATDDGGSSAAAFGAALTVLLAAAAGVWFSPLRPRVLALVHANAASPVAVVADAGVRAPDPVSSAPASRWVSVATPAQPFRLGRLAHHEPHAGYVPGAGDLFTGPAFEIQDREVTFGEYEAFAHTHTERAANPPAWVPADPARRAPLPAVGVGSANARAYCQDLGGDLPTEAQWEFAARGNDRRSNPWGEGAPPGDLYAYRGLAATLAPVASCSADRTPEGIMDLAGSVPEWTGSPWRADDAVSPAQGMDALVVRGLPLREPRPAVMPPSALVRTEGCDLPRCAPAARAMTESVGFRCARPAMH